MGSGCFWFGAGWLAGGLVVARGVDGQFADELAGGGVADAGVQVLDGQQGAGCGVGAAGAGVVGFPVDAEGELAVGVGAVGADPVVGAGRAVAGGGLGPGGVGGGRGGAVRQAAVRAPGVADDGEGVEQGLQLGRGAGRKGLCAEPVLEGLLEAFGFPLGLRVAGRAVLLPDPQAAQLGLQPVAAALPPDSRVVNTRPSVSVEAGGP